MPSGITHILLTRGLQKHLTKDCQRPMKSILAACGDALAVGSVGPDLPYACFGDNDLIFNNKSMIADCFHYYDTNQIPLRALQILRQKKEEKYPKKSLGFMFSFFIGYISHLVADGIVHPFVRDKVGNYKGNEGAHRSLEMQLDVLLYQYLTRGSGIVGEVNYISIHDKLIELQQGAEIKDITALFKQLILEIYRPRLLEDDIQEVSEDNITGWMTGLYRLFELAEGEHPKIYRTANLTNGFIYRNYNDLFQNKDQILILTTPKDRPTNFLNQQKINFIDDCLPKFYDTFIPIAEKAYAYVYSNGPALTSSDIPAISLDTGRLLSENEGNDLNATPYFWRALA